MKRTTILLDEEILGLLHRLARQKGISKSMVIREAVRAYVEKASTRAPDLPSFTGCGESSHAGSLGRDAEELLKRKTRRQGWK